MARRSELKNEYRPRVVGDLAFDPAYEERRRAYEQERERREGREREEFIRPPKPAPQRSAAPARRAREHVSVGALIGFVSLAVMFAVLLSCHAQLTALSANVVSMQKELSALEEEHVELLSRYEKTFDLSAIKEAAAAAGMNKPSASQIYYIDLSEPDSVVVYRQSDGNVLSRVLTSLGQGVCAVVEYFK